MSAEEDYIERFSDLMEDAESEGVDGINIMMNYLMAYVEAMTGDEEEQGIIWQLGDKDLVISIEQQSKRRGFTDAYPMASRVRAAEHTSNAVRRLHEGTNARGNLRMF